MLSTENSNVDAGRPRSQLFLKREVHFKTGRESMHPAIARKTGQHTLLCVMDCLVVFSLSVAAQNKILGRSSRGEKNSLSVASPLLSRHKELEQASTNTAQAVYLLWLLLRVRCCMVCPAASNTPTAQSRWGD